MTSSIAARVKKNDATINKNEGDMRGGHHITVAAVAAAAARGGTVAEVVTEEG